MDDIRSVGRHYIQHRRLIPDSIAGSTYTRITEKQRYIWPVHDRIYHHLTLRSCYTPRMEYAKLSVTGQAAQLLRRVTLEMGEIQGHRVTQGYALETLAGDWLASLYRARDAERAAAVAAAAMVAAGDLPGAWSGADLTRGATDAGS